MTKRERALDRALSGKQVADEELTALAQPGERLRDAFDVEVPTKNAERALFVQAVGARRKPLGWMRTLAPVSVTAAAAIVILLLGSTALPGQTFYPVREVMRSVGLAPASLAEIDEWLDQADALLTKAEDSYVDDETQAERLAVEAVKLLGAAEELIDDDDSEAIAARENRIRVLSLRAEALLTTGPIEPEGNGGSGDDDNGVLGRDDQEDDEGPDEDGDDDDRSGEDSGGADHDSGEDQDDGDDDDDDDRSGSNSGSDDDDDGSNSGSGDGDDGDDDDDRDGDDTNDEVDDLDDEEDELDGEEDD